MERLTSEQQADIRKMSTGRIMACMIKAGLDEETVYSKERPQLMEEWAELVAQGRETPPDEGNVRTQLTATGLDLNLQREMFMFEKQRYEEERRREEDERKRRNDEEREERRRREKEEREDRLKRDEREFKLREEQLKVEQERRRQEELERQARDVERSLRESLTSKIKHFNGALKGILGQFPQDSAEIPCYFDHVEKLFDQCKIDRDVRAKLLLANLSERAKALTGCTFEAQLNNYQDLKEFLLREFRISPVQLRERFYTTRKSPEETYTVLASKLRNALLYYLGSGQVTDQFDELVSLLCADRLKELIPRGSINFILAQEKGGWLKDDELASTVDTFMASHNLNGDPVRYGSTPLQHDKRAFKPTNPNNASRTPKVESDEWTAGESKISKEEALR